MRLDPNVRIDRFESSAGAVNLRRADAIRGVQQLSLEVRQLHAVRIDDAQPTDAGSHQVQRRWGTKAAGADDEHGCLPEALLSCHADTGQ